jgi:hypothetical protein
MRQMPASTALRAGRGHVGENQKKKRCLTIPLAGLIYQNMILTMSFVHLDGYLQIYFDSVFGFGVFR